ncbi:hypothetical protein BH20ACT15_BH20ACT15_00050 [soil metagenome]
MIKPSLLVAALVVALLAVPAAAQACRNADRSGAELSTGQAQRAIRCLVNHRRGDRRARKLDRRGTLEAAAQYHAIEMTTLGYLSHSSPSGGDAYDRAALFGYLNGGKGRVGEVLASGTQWSPRGTVKAWLSSAPHRNVILNRRFRHIGVGVTTSAGLVFYSVSVGYR